MLGSEHFDAQLMPGALARRASVVSSEVAPIISVRAT